MGTVFDFTMYEHPPNSCFWHWANMVLLMVLLKFRKFKVRDVKYPNSHEQNNDFRQKRLADYVVVKSGHRLNNSLARQLGR
jgi:hypothetical protein